MPSNELELLSAIAQLPPLRKVAQPQKHDVFCKKLKFCCIQCNYANERGEVRLKNVKRQVLHELIDFVDSCKGMFTESTYSLSVQMFAANIFRPVQFKIEFYDYMDIDEDSTMKGWVHLALVYIYFLKFLGSNEFQPSKAKRFFTTTFVQKVVEMFHVEGMNEREHLKTLLHRIYAKFLGLRSLIRKAVSNKLLEKCFEDVKFDGVSELLEVMGSIINGYIRPYKPEHTQFLEQVLIPLHSCRNLGSFHPHLVYCVIQFIEREEELMQMFMKRFMKRWPKVSPQKEILFIGELEELIDVMQPNEFASMTRLIFTQLARCIRSDHFQVTERTLFLWENEYIVSLMDVSHEEVFPIILPSLLHVSNFYWNKMTASLANDVLTKFLKPGGEQFEKVVARVKKQKWNEQKKRQLLNRKWDAIEKLARNSPLCRSTPSVCVVSEGSSVITAPDMSIQSRNPMYKTGPARINRHSLAT